MSFAEREMEKEIDAMEGAGEDPSRVRGDLARESARHSHARGR